MQDSSLTIIQAIQAILAPALGISAVGLLLLGLSSRYSNIVNRIRLLNDEKRKFSRLLVEKGELGYTDNGRLISIAKQTQELLARSRYVRNGMLLFQSAIVMFVLASLGISLNLFFSSGFFRLFPLVIFSLGMIALLAGVLFAAIEIHRSFKIILIEVKGEE
jgi:hypothetical protein